MTIQWMPVNDDDLSLVDKTVEFLQSEFCPPDSEPMWSVEYFQWKLGAANPAGNGYISVALLDDRVVGAVSLTKKRLFIDGQEVIGGEVGDSYSSASVRRNSRPAVMSSLDPDPESYLNKSIFGRLASDVRARAESRGLSIIYGTPNQNAYPGWIKRLGYFDKEGFGCRSYSRPRSLMLLKRYPALSAATALIGGTEKMVRALEMAFSLQGYRHLSVAAEAPLSTDIDALWDRVKPVSGFSLIRDGVYWRHRYIEHPIAKYSFLTIREYTRLVGLIVVRYTMIEGGRRVAYLAEWMAESKINFGYLLNTTMAHYECSDVERFNFWASECGSESKAAACNLFFSRHRVPVIFADTPQARSVLRDPSKFYFFLGSGDAV
jgi:hypothetical protein